jgi:hypothetical protein
MPTTTNVHTKPTTPIKRSTLMAMMNVKRGEKGKDEWKRPPKEERARLE